MAELVESWWDCTRPVPIWAYNIQNHDQSAGSCTASKALSLLNCTSSAQLLTHKRSFILQAPRPCTEQGRQVDTISSASYRNYECHGLWERQKIWRVSDIIKSKLLINMMAGLFAALLTRLHLLSITRQIIIYGVRSSTSCDSNPILNKQELFWSATMPLTDGIFWSSLFQVTVFH